MRAEKMLYFGMEQERLYRHIVHTCSHSRFTYERNIRNTTSQLKTIQQIYKQISNSKLECFYGSAWVMLVISKENLCLCSAAQKLECFRISGNLCTKLRFIFVFFFAQSEHLSRIERITQSRVIEIIETALGQQNPHAEALISLCIYI